MNPNKTERAGIKKQFPLVYMQQTPNNKHNAKYIESGTKISLCFLINFGKLVKENASNNADATIQNQERVLSIAKLQIKHGMRAIA